jgi:phage tail sheath gpL-like
VIAGTETAAEIAALITAAINGAPELAITATDNEDGTISLENDAFGSVGNVAITETVADTDFVVAGMSGGYGGDVTALLDINGAVNLAIDSLYSKSFKLQSGYLYNLQLTVDGIIRALSVSASK